MRRISQSQRKIAVAEDVPDRLPVDPVASITTCVQPSESSHSDSASSSAVVVLNEPTSRLTT